MRTTIDIPGKLLQKAKVRAVEEGVPLKAILVRALEREVGSGPNLLKRQQRTQRLFAALDKSRNEHPIPRLDREALYDRTLKCRD